MTATTTGPGYPAVSSPGVDEVREALEAHMSPARAEQTLHIPSAALHWHSLADLVESGEGARAVEFARTMFDWGQDHQ
jgi:hypothetical protein